MKNWSAQLTILFSCVLLSVSPICMAADIDLYSNPAEMLVLANATPSPAGPSLEDLGFSQAQTEGSSQDQATLDKRSHMLKVHQRLGLITTIPLIATVLVAPGNKSSTSDRTLHGGLGLLTAGLYFTTASYAIRAPKIPGTKDKGPIRLHKALVWIHFPGMILTPILGAMADEQRNAGEKVHGIASAHGVVATMTVASYLAAILAVSIKW
jgi:hypothetical protein